jgi:hypothetical protein
MRYASVHSSRPGDEGARFVPWLFQAVRVPGRFRPGEFSGFSGLSRVEPSRDAACMDRGGRQPGPVRRSVSDARAHGCAEAGHVAGDGSGGNATSTDNFESGLSAQTVRCAGNAGICRPVHHLDDDIRCGEMGMPRVPSAILLTVKGADPNRATERADATLQSWEHIRVQRWQCDDTKHLVCESLRAGQKGNAQEPSGADVQRERDARSHDLPSILQCMLAGPDWLASGVISRIWRDRAGRRIGRA